MVLIINLTYHNYIQGYQVTNNGFGTVSEALRVKRMGINIFSIGFDLARNEDAKATMAGIALSARHNFNATDNLDEVFQNSAGKITQGRSNAIVENEMGSDEVYKFTIIKYDKSYTINISQGSYNINNSNNKITWDLEKEKDGGPITQKGATLTYYVKLDMDRASIAEDTIVYSNKEAIVSYKNTIGNWVKQYFERPYSTIVKTAVA